MTNAIFDAEYADFKPIKSRSVVQIIFEIPIEKANHVLQMMGMPNYGTPDWYGIAKLNKTENGEGVVPTSRAVPESELVSSPATSSTKWADMTYAQRAGMLSNDKDFWEFMRVSDKEEAAECIRKNCGVESRRYIDRSADAKAAFHVLYDSFDHWRKYERTAA